jgi:hypothetical protein
VANNLIFVSSNLPVAEIPSTIVKYNSFSTAQTNTVLWTPATGKSIYLTAISISSLITINASLQRASNVVFLVASVTSLAPVPFNTSFLSPIKFDSNESIYVTTNAIGAVNITLFGYEE